MRRLRHVGRYTKTDEIAGGMIIRIVFCGVMFFTIHETIDFLWWFLLVYIVIVRRVKELNSKDAVSKDNLPKTRAEFEAMGYNPPAHCFDEEGNYHSEWLLK